VTKIALYIQMELCRTTLEEQLEKLNERYPRLDDEAGYRIRLGMAQQIVEAVYTIHKVRHLIHRDLSLHNVFIAHDDRIKIGDFGLATECKHLIRQLSSPNCLRPVFPTAQPDPLLLLDPESADSSHTGHLGTRTFAAPEQLNGVTYDQSVFVFNISLHIGRHIFVGTDIIGVILSDDDGERATVDPRSVFRIGAAR
jgi:translation initiation factor 2-alpha kinase 1